MDVVTAMGGLSRFGILVAVACLAGAFRVEHEMGSAFLLGAFFACLIGSTLLFSYGTYVRRTTGARGGAASPDAAGGHLIARLAHRAAVDVHLHRQSSSRLTGTVAVRNNEREAIRLTGVRVLHPEGAKVATGREGDRAQEVSVHFESDSVETDREIAPGATEEQRIYVLLPAGKVETTRLRLEVALLGAGDPARARRHPVRARVRE